MACGARASTVTSLTYDDIVQICERVIRVGKNERKKRRKYGKFIEITLRFKEFKDHPELIEEFTFEGREGYRHMNNPIYFIDQLIKEKAQRLITSAAPGDISKVRKKKKREILYIYFIYYFFLFIVEHS